ncbi:MAG: hypothetical protein QOI21_4193 [Actinomycetota bacterium]|jgi:AcrR family transcriptional regulator|nr:hypothetical protein [Actinomycetota bacterium]
MRAAGQATRERILTAAKEEFARYGLAGARVDRIATAAQASKERLYAYFGSKEELFAMVTQRWITETTDETSMTAEDIPGYVGRLFDHYLRRPEDARLQTWAGLEQVYSEPSDGAIYGILAPKLAEIRRGQRAEIIAAEWDPADLLVILTEIARAAALRAAYAREAGGHGDVIDARRKAAVLAAHRLVVPDVTA